MRHTRQPAAGAIEDAKWREENVDAKTYPMHLTPLAKPAEATTWLADAKRGDRRALELFYRDNHQQVYALCFRILGSADDAEDAMQAAFVRAFRALPGFRGQSSLQTWLYRIAVNEALQALRRRPSSRTVAMPEDAMCPDGSARVDERLAVRAAMAAMKPEMRVVIALRFWEELSYEEVAAVLGISLPAARMRIKRAREEFQRLYGAETA
jgi:RNA polymerase sigma-70 factor (ECF subfamily)